MNELLKVYQFDNKIRLGDNYDGGYVIGDLENNFYDCYITAGISLYESFSRDFINKYNTTDNYGFDGTIDKFPTEYTDKVTFIKKNINSFNDQNHTNLSFLTDKYKNLFLNMDIEGGEWAWLLSSPDLNNFKQISIEFHGINDNSWGCSLEKKMICIKYLNEKFYCIHAHGNNYSNTKNSIPDVIEMTYVNKNYFKNEIELNKTVLPIPLLDFPNKQNNLDFSLNFYPFVN